MSFNRLTAAAYSNSGTTPWVRMDGKRTQVRAHAGLEATFDELQRDS